MEEIYHQPNIDIGLVIINAGLMNNGNFDKVSIRETTDMIDVNLY